MGEGGNSARRRVQRPERARRYCGGGIEKGRARRGGGGTANLYEREAADGGWGEGSGCRRCRRLCAPSYRGSRNDRCDQAEVRWTSNRGGVRAEELHGAAAGISERLREGIQQRRRDHFLEPVPSRALSRRYRDRSLADGGVLGVRGKTGQAPQGCRRDCQRSFAASHSGRRRVDHVEWRFWRNSPEAVGRPPGGMTRS